MAKLFFMAVYLLSMLGLMSSKPVAVVHIGPHKAASTYIQGTLSNKASELTEHGLFWPRSRGAPMRAKGVADFALALRPPRRQNESDPGRTSMVEFFKQSLALQRNIVLSSEEFGPMPSSSVQLLYSLLSGFEVKLVYVYREFLSHILSLHFEMNRYEHNVKYSEPFSDFLIARMDNKGGVSILQPIATLTKFGEVFGNDSLHVIDLAGSEAVQKDIAYVVYCEIAGVMCEDTTPAAVGGNTGYSLIVAEVFSHYRAYTESQNDFKCRFCATSIDEYKYFKVKHAAYLLAPENALPVVSSKLSMLIPLAEKEDRDVREAYGTHFLYGNQSANVAAMRSGINATQLNGPRFALSPEWIRWVHTAFDAARADNRLCECG